MNITATDICVDAGMIMVADLDYLKTVNKKASPEKFGKVFDIPNGRYNVSWKINETWNGTIEGHNETLEVTAGKVFVSDPCYVIGKTHEKWLEWLNDTNYGEDVDSDKAFIISDMGGDGVYEIMIELNKI